MTTYDTTTPTPVRSADPALRGWIANWNPEDEDTWNRGGRRLALRNLVASVLSEHIGFSVWTMWSVLVLFMSPAIGLPFGASEKFLLVAMPTLVGAVLRLPYSRAVLRFGGRNWTIFASAVLLVPTLLALYFVQQPGTPLWVFLLIGATAGVGGGNFASSMTNITLLFPQRHQGWALGVNAGGGNLGVAAIQLLGLLLIATVGDTHPSYVAAAYLPLIALSTLLAALRMDNVRVVAQTEPGRWRLALANPHTWWISFLYIGTFGSFIGYSFAFGLVLQNQFGATPLQAASYTFIGPLLGSLARPLGGWLADRHGGARVTLVSLLGMAFGAVALITMSAHGTFGMFVAGFVVMFVFTGLGNGSTYKMIPTVAARWARDTFAGHDQDTVHARAKTMSGLTIGVAGAIGALGGVGINLLFLASYRDTGTGASAFVGFLAFYALCLLVVWTVYLRRSGARR